MFTQLQKKRDPSVDYEYQAKLNENVATNSNEEESVQEEKELVNGYKFTNMRKISSNPDKASNSASRLFIF